MFSKDLYGSHLGSPEYRAELSSSMSRPPVKRNDIPPMYARIKSDTRSHKCAECDKLHYEIERLEMKLDEKSSRGSRMAMLDSQESTRSRDYKNNSEWKGSWAATPDDLSTHTKGPNRQKGQYKDMEADIKRLKRELHQKSLEVRMLREAKSKSPNTNGSSDLPSDLDAMVDPLPPGKISEMYINVYKTDWPLANKALLNDKVSQEQAASKLLKILTTAFAYCDKVAPEHLEAILASTIKVKPVQGNVNIPNLPNENVTIHQEAGLFRKCIADKVAINVIKNFRYEVFMKMSQFTAQQKQNYDITKYVDKCVNITWYMAVQNYPIILDDSVLRDKEFDLEHYDIFQEEEPEGEETYAYLIWPALINEQNNIYLCKGVAEPAERK